MGRVTVCYDTCHHSYKIQTQKGLENSMNYESACREAFQAIRDVSSGRYSGERGTSAMSVEVLIPVAEVFAALNPSDEVSLSQACDALRKLCEKEHKVMSNYPSILLFAFEGEKQSTASN